MIKSAYEQNLGQLDPDTKKIARKQGKKHEIIKKFPGL